MVINTETIEKILNQHDIEGLLAAGAPHDEYESEACDIAAALEVMNDSDMDIAHVCALIAEIWQRSFGLTDADVLKRKETFLEVAGDIVAAVEA
jgi:hypothetical protein